MLDFQRNPAGLGLRGQFSSVEIIGFGQAFLIIRNIKSRTFGELSDEIQIFRCEIFGKGLNTCGYAIGEHREETILRAKAEAVERLCLHNNMLPVPDPDRPLKLFNADKQPLDLCRIKFEVELPTIAAFTNSSGIASDADPNLAQRKARSEFIEHSVLTLLPFCGDLVRRCRTVKLDELDDSGKLSVRFLLNRGYSVRLRSLALDEHTWICYAVAHKADAWPDYIFGSAAHSLKRSACSNAIREVMLTLAARFDMVLTRRSRSVDRQMRLNSELHFPRCPIKLDNLRMDATDGALYQRSAHARFDTGETLYVTRALLPHHVDLDSGLVTLPVRTLDLEELFKNFGL